MTKDAFISDEEVQSVMALSEHEAKNELISQIKFGREYIQESFAEKRELSELNRLMAEQLQKGISTLEQATKQQESIRKNIDSVILKYNVWKSTSYLLALIVVLLCIWIELRGAA